jgi:hypothetical protein
MKTNTQNAPIFTEAVPASQALPLSDILQSIKTTIHQHAIVDDGVSSALALWVVHTYVYTAREAVAYVAIESPEKRCGKTTLLSVLSAMACRSIVASNITSGAIFTAIEEHSPTLFIDEADTFLAGNSVMRGILNCGNTIRTAYVLRSVPTRRDRSAAADAAEGGRSFSRKRVVRYSCYCPKVVALIGTVPETIADRAIVVRMERKSTAEAVVPLSQLDASGISAQCARFARDCAYLVERHHIMRIEGINDRAADTYEPLAVLADIAGGEWPGLLTAVAQHLESPAAKIAAGSELVLAVLGAFAMHGVEKMFTRHLVQEINQSGRDVNMACFGGRAANEFSLSKALRCYGIRPKAIRIGCEVNKGYCVDDFRSAREKYVTQAEARLRAAELTDEIHLEGEARAEAEKLAKQRVEERRQEKQQDLADVFSMADAFGHMSGSGADDTSEDDDDAPEGDEQEAIS